MLAVGGHVLTDFDPSIARMVTGFAGGVGESQQEMCGALSAGVMLIGALHGRNSLEEDDLPALELATSYRERFAAARHYPLRSTVRTGPCPWRPWACSIPVERAARILLGLLAEKRS